MQTRTTEKSKGLRPHPHLSCGHSFLLAWELEWRRGSTRLVPKCAWFIYEASINNGLSPSEPAWVVGITDIAMDIYL